MNIFISYSRKDYLWVKKISTYLANLSNSEDLTLLSDMYILPGQNWHEQIKKFIELSDVAIILISPSYLASNFLYEFELSSILKSAQKNKIKVIPIITQETSIEGEILAYDFLNPLSQPLSSLSELEQNIYLKKLVELLKEILKTTNKKNNIKENSFHNNIDSIRRSIESHKIFYGSGENIFIQAERELESNK